MGRWEACALASTRRAAPYLTKQWPSNTFGDGCPRSRGSRAICHPVRTGVRSTCGPFSPYCGRGCEKSLRSSYTGLYPQNVVRQEPCPLRGVSRRPLHASQMADARGDYTRGQIPRFPCSLTSTFLGRCKATWKRDLRSITQTTSRPAGRQRLRSSFLSCPGSARASWPGWRDVPLPSLPAHQHSAI